MLAPQVRTQARLGSLGRAARGKTAQPGLFADDLVFAVARAPDLLHLIREVTEHARERLTVLGAVCAVSVHDEPSDSRARALLQESDDAVSLAA